jgi:glucose-1-phosphatase
VMFALRSEAGRRMNTTDGPPALVYELVAPAIGFPGGLEDFTAIWNGIFRPNDPVFPVIEALHGRVPLLVLSNTNAMHMAHLRRLLPVLDRFDAVLTSHELGLVKPDAAIYEAALLRAGVAPGEAAFFDDLPGHVEGARRVGMRGFVFSDVDGFVADLTALGLWNNGRHLPPPSPNAGRGGAMPDE